MRKNALLLLSIGFLLLASCGNGEQESSDVPGDEKRTVNDSLFRIVTDGHDVGMAKYGRLRSMKLRAEQMIDSITRLPAEQKAAAELLREQLFQLTTELSDAREAMDKWMNDFHHTRDSAADNPRQREQFLRDEIIRVNKVRDAILNSLARADSLLK